MLLAACASDRHAATGRVVELDAGGGGVTIDHDAIPGLMPAMQMHFGVRDPGLLEGVRPGAEVRFMLEPAAGTLVVTNLAVVGGPPRPRPGVHDHTPHHGGVVTMVGLRHVEALARPDGHVLAYLTDAWRRPLPLRGWSGQARLATAAGVREVALRPAGAALVGTGPPLSGRDVTAHIHLVEAGDPVPIDVHLTLPLAAGAAGTAAAPEVRCRRPDAAPAEAGPRCTLDFARPITALAVVPGTTWVAIGVAGAGVSFWDLDTNALAGVLDPPPPVAGQATRGAAHAEIVDALAAAPDGAQMLVASEGRLLRHATATGRLLRVLPSPVPLLRSLEWRADGSIVAVGATDRHAWRLTAADGALLARLPTGAPVTAAATVPGTGLIVLGTEDGEVAIAGPAPRRLATVARPVRDLAATADRIVVATGAGTLELLALSNGTRLASSDAASPCHRIAVAASLRLVACAAFDRHVRLYDLGSGALVAKLVHHEAMVQALAFAGDRLLTADAAGVLALWDGPGRRP